MSRGERLHIVKRALSWPLSSAFRASSLPLLLYAKVRCLSFSFFNDMLPISFHPSSVLETILLLGKVLSLCKVIVISKGKCYTGTATIEG